MVNLYGIPFTFILIYLLTALKLLTALICAFHACTWSKV